MKNFDFYVPTALIFGKGTIGRLGGEIDKRGHKNVLLAAGGGSIKKNGVYRSVTDSLRRSGIKWVEYWGVRPNPELSKVYDMIELAKKQNVDAILGVGGGSVIDSAKAVAAGIYMDDVWGAFEDRDLEVEKAMSIYSVLTISATGTEMNDCAVITNESEKKKWNISGPALYPAVSIIDPAVQTSLPWNQTVNAAIDAVSHVMEYYFMGGDSETVLALDESLMKTMIKLTDALMKESGSYDLRANFAWAATLSLNGISGAGQDGGDWASHGIEHSISAFYPDVAHGAGLGVVFPAWIEYCQYEDPSLFKRWARNVWQAEDVRGAVIAMRAKMKKWGSPVTLRELGVAGSKINDIAANAYESGLTGSMKKLKKKDIVNILKSAL